LSDARDAGDAGGAQEAKKRLKAKVRQGAVRNSGASHKDSDVLRLERQNNQLTK
jgi:hypothetical protein